jgi:transposase InsO family protein
MLTIVDEFTRECLAIDVAKRLTSEDVLERLSDLFVHRGVPEHIRSDNGSEFTAKCVREWLGRVGVKTLFIEPGSRERPPQPALTALIASRVDTFQPVFKEATHGSTGRPAEVRGMAATAAAVHDIRHNGVEVLRSSGCIGHRFPLLAAEARSAAA